MDGDIRTPEVKVEVDQPAGPPFPGMQFSVGPDHAPHHYAAPPHHGAQYLGMGRTDPAPQYSAHPHPGIHLPPRPDLGSPYTAALDAGPQYLGRPDLAIAYSAPPQPTYMSQPHPGIPLPVRPEAGMPYSALPSRAETIDPFDSRPGLVEPGVSEMGADGPSGIQDPGPALADATAPEADTGPPQGDLGGDTDVAMTTNDEDSVAGNSESPESEAELDESKADDEGPRPFPCDECAVTFVDRLQLAIHERMHGDQQPLPCRECGREFYSSLALSRHERVHMPRPPTDASVEGGRRRKGGSHAQVTERSVKCGVCEEEFGEQEMREQHLGYWWCGQCQHVFGLRCQLSRHGCAFPDIKEEQDPDSPAPPALLKNKRKPGRPRKLKPEEATPIENKRKKREESKKAHLSLEEEESEPPAIPAQLETSIDEEPPEPKTRRPRKSAVPKQYLSSDPEDTEQESEESDPEWTGEMEYVECSDEDETPATPSSKTVKCEICDKTFRSHNNLSRHLIRHISHKIADHAFKEGKRKSKFEKDDNESSAAASDMPTKFKCKMCGQGFHSRVTMQRHKQSEHGAPGIRYQCELCPMSYDRSDLITRHTMKEHGQERTHKCTKCKACFTQASLLECHMKLHERARTPYVPYRMRAKCNVCKTRFRSEELMAKHECPGPRARVICDVCGRSCATEAVLRRHQLLHVTYRPCGCDTCGARFVDKYALKAHMKTHLPDRPHVCHVCARGFKARGLLKRHMQFHTDERPFVCDHCGKAFKAANQLQNHIRIHTGEKPFPCTICSKPFRQAQQLKTHMKTHDPNKPHKTPKRQDEGWVQDLLMGSVRETHAPESAALFRLAQPLPAQHAAEAPAGGLAQGTLNQRPSMGALSPQNSITINQRPIMGALSPQNSITTSAAGSIRSGM